MTDEEVVAAQKEKMHRAVGECVLTWSWVEVHMASIFACCIGASGVTADTVLSIPKAFEVRSQMVHAAVRIFLANHPLLDDWNLIYNYVCKMSGRRNEVAHATMLSVDNKFIVLEPYFVMTSPKTHIAVEEVERRAAEFTDLHLLMAWLTFEFHAVRHPVPQIRFPTSAPDLLLRLRTENDQRREAQRARQKPSAE